MSHELKGIYGIAYSSSSSSNTYCEDWLLPKFSSVYRNNNNRNLNKVKELGFNHIRTYYLLPDGDHHEFLELASNLNLSIEIGISNNLLEGRDSESIRKLVNSTRNYKCVKIYTVGNEYFGNVDNIIFGLELVYAMNTNKYLMHSTIFDDKFQSVKKVLTKLSNNSGIKDKYIVSLNMYFYSNKASTHGDVVQNVLKDYYSDPILSNTYLIISEFGNNSTNGDEQWASLWNFNFGNIECLKTYNKYLGFCLFSFTNESWKGSHNGENNYGILTENGDKKNGYYAVENFKNTDQFKQCIRK